MINYLSGDNMISNANDIIRNKISEKGPMNFIKIFITLTEKEQKGNFRLELVSLEQLENMILSNENDNPRNIYFQKELLTLLDSYKKIKQGICIKKLELK